MSYDLTDFVLFVPILNLTHFMYVFCYIIYIYLHANYSSLIFCCLEGLSTAEETSVIASYNLRLSQCRGN